MSAKSPIGPVAAEPSHCPECGAALDPSRMRCWLCHREVPARSEQNPYASPPSAADTAPVAQFSIATLMLVMTLVAVCFGLTMLAPGLGILLIVITMPALVRTIVAGIRRKQAGMGLTTAQKIGTFVVSLGSMALIGLAGCTAFVAVCFPVGLAAMAANNEPGMVIALLVGSLVALALVSWLLWLAWPRKAAGR